MGKYGDYPADSYGSQIWLSDYEIDQLLDKYGKSVTKLLSKSGETPSIGRVIAISKAAAVREGALTDKWPKHRAGKEKTLVAQKGGYADGRGPMVHVFDGAGTFGTTLVVIKKGQDLVAKGLENASLQTGAGKFQNVMDFDVTGGFKVIKETGAGTGGLSTWLADNADNYLVRWESADNVNPQTGQHRAFDLDIHPEGITEKIGVTVGAFPGLLLEEDEYQVIDVGLTVLKSGVDSAGKLAGGIIGAVFPAPNEWGELVKGVAEVVKSGTEWKEAMEKLGGHKGDIGKTGLLMLSFSPVAGGGGSLTLDCQFKRKSDDRFGFGVKISDATPTIMSLARGKLAGA